MSSAPAIVDSHCHLDYGPLADEIEDVLARASDAGVRAMVTISTQLSTFPRVLAIAERFDNVFATVGVHPHHASEEQDVTAARLVELAAYDKIIGIGEAGLDYHYDRSPRDVQQAVFRRHIAASRETGLPLVIHSREAEEDTARILEEETKAGAFPFLMHCFTSAPWLAERAVELGGYVSFSGILTFGNAEGVREAARLVPAERLLVETDAPFLAPAPHRGKPCEPAHVAITLAKLAEIKGMAADEMARMTSDNFFRLFAKAKRPAVFNEAA